MTKLKVALLGSIPKGDDERKQWVDWKTDYKNQISHALPLAQFLDGDLISDNAGPALVVGHDLWVIKNADIVIVHAASKIGAGTAQEMVLAKSFQRPLVSVVPKNTHHRRSNIVFHGVTVEDWIHPFIFTASDFIAEDIGQAIEWIRDYLKNRPAVKTLAVFDEAISRFESGLPDIVESYRKNGW